MYKYTRGFLKILQRYINNTSSPEEKRVMNYWYESIDQDVADEKTASEKLQLEAKLWRKIQAKTQPVTHQPEFSSTNWWERNFGRLAVAATVALVAGLVYFIANVNSPSPMALNGLTTEQAAALTTLTNTGNVPKRIQLSDGSQVTLEPTASLYYPRQFEKNRRVVYLVGDGFFNISKDPQKPFFVYSESIVTKVLGTSFTIRKNKKSGDIEVAVNTGRVIVEKSAENSLVNEKPSNGVVLTPNEKVTYHQISRSVTTGLVDNPVLVDASQEFHKPDAFSFVEAPLSTVIEKLEKAYGVDISLLNKSISDCPITASLPNESLFAKLEIINTLLNSTTEIKGTTIVMSGGDCVPFKSVSPNP